MSAGASSFDILVVGGGHAGVEAAAVAARMGARVGLVSFARDRLAEIGDPLQAALEAGYVRLRPVLMTALAMIIGMIPMALGIGEGAEQNAPLGRAVIGGLITATIATLFFVPAVFSLAHRQHINTSANNSTNNAELMPHNV